MVQAGLATTLGFRVLEPAVQCSTVVLEPACSTAGSVVLCWSIVSSLLDPTYKPNVSSDRPDC